VEHNLYRRAKQLVPLSRGMERRHDEHGKPNIGPYPCGGILIINIHTQEIIRSGQYWALAHFSRAIRRGARRFESQSQAANLGHVALENPDGQKVLILTNLGAARTIRVNQGRSSAIVPIAENSIANIGLEVTLIVLRDAKKIASGDNCPLLREHQETIRLAFRRADNSSTSVRHAQRREFIKSVLGSALLWKAPTLLALQVSSTPPAPDPGVKRVLVMFKCHFDAGFIDTQTAVVHVISRNIFHGPWISPAKLRHSGSHRYVWTRDHGCFTNTWSKQRPRNARGWRRLSLSRHRMACLPFTWQTELMDGSMISGSVGLSRSLDQRFGRTTTGAKMTDVPGHTRGLIAPLAAQGVKFLDIGVNDASTPAEVPPLFLWKDPGGSTLVVMYHHGYGGVVPVPDSDLAIAMVVRDDDSGPHTLEEIHETYSTLSGRSQTPRLSLRT